MAALGRWPGQQQPRPARGVWSYLGQSLVSSTVLAIPCPVLTIAPQLIIRRLWKSSDRRRLPAAAAASTPLLIQSDSPLPYSWVLTRRLAVGPMPSSAAHWQQLEQAGLRGRFSCCYPQEEGPPPPSQWLNDGLPLPDHRRQEPLQLERLAEALQRAEQLLRQGTPLYLHCMAGIERSPLLAVGLTARQRDLSLFEALDWVRRCHPPSLPIVSQMELLGQLLQRT